MKVLQEYLRETFGVQDKPRPEKKLVRKLPLYLRGNYNYYTSRLGGQILIWAEVKAGNTVTPDQLQKQRQILQEYLGRVLIVFVFDNLETWQRKRLIEKKVGFAEPLRQLYVPEMFIQLKEGGRKELPFIPVNKKVKPPTQLLLLYHLQKEQLEGKYFQDIAKLLNYSPMTITRSVKELAALQLLKSGKEKKLEFTHHGHNLWNQALPFLESPVRDSWYSEKAQTNKYTRFGGETALAVYSMLSAPEYQTIVIGKDDFRSTKQHFKGLDRKYGNHKMEIWHYDPVILTDSNEVDRLSLYLSLKDHEDERVQGALHKMINEIKWS